jgi:uncharacterized cupredoxin-like copper-binding protein
LEETTMSETHTASPRIAPTVIGVLTVLLICAVLIIVGLAVRPSGGLAVPQGSRVLHVDERDFALHMPTTTLHAGTYVFVDTNHGPSAHELVMWKTDDPAARLPLLPSHRVNEDSPALSSVLDSGTSLDPGQTRLLSATLSPGHYVIACNLPGHFIAGMHLDITVT